MTGIPMHTVAGTNKFSAFMGTTFAIAGYYKSGKIHIKAAIAAAIFALVGSGSGSRINLLIEAGLLKKIMLFILPVVAVIVLIGYKKDKPHPELTDKKLYIACAFIGFFIGLYDGLIGPGTGTFLIFCFTGIVGYDYVSASGSAKVVNWASNLASLIVFASHGQVDFSLGLPAAACSIIGGIIGSRLAILKGNKFIKVMLIVVLAGIFVKLAIDVF